MIATIGDPDELKGDLKSIGGSRSDHWNNLLANSAMKTLWTAHSDNEGRDQQYRATLAALVGIEPKDELEGMLAAQLLATHYATMECHRRAMIDEQTFEGRRENLNQANRLSRTYSTLLEALNRHRGKKAPRRSGLNASPSTRVGRRSLVNVGHPGGGSAPKTEDQPHAPETRPLAHEPGTTMPSAIEAERDAVPVAGRQG